MQPLYTSKAQNYVVYLLLIASLFLAPPPALSQSPFTFELENEVDLELVLAVDISQSMDPEEQRIQRDGYIAALTSQEVLGAIQYGPLGRIAVQYLEWGGKEEQFVIADWAVISDPQTARAFVNRIAEAPLRRVQRTSISSALAEAVHQLQTNQYNGVRRVIDISGDGPNNQGPAVIKARDAALAQGVTINGLPLMLKQESISWQSMLHLDHYYEDCVIGGPGAFVIPVRSKEGFEEAIRMKLVLEIAGLAKDHPKLIQTDANRDPVMCSLFD